MTAEADVTEVVPLAKANDHRIWRGSVTAGYAKEGQCANGPRGISLTDSGNVWSVDQGSSVIGGKRIALIHFTSCDH